MKSITTDKNNVYKGKVPAIGIVRHEFLNLFIRCAIRKYKIEPKN